MSGPAGSGAAASAGRGRARRALPALLLAAWAAGVPALPPPPDAADPPLSLASGGLFGGLFLEPVSSDARALPAPELELRWTVANDWSTPAPFRSAGRLVALQADAQSDALSARARLPWSRLLGRGAERLASELELRLVAHWGGWTDRPIEAWHGLAGTTNFQRARWPRSAVRVQAWNLDSGRGLELRSSQLAPGDLVLRTQLTALEGGTSFADPARSRWGLALRIDAKAPLGPPGRLGGSGGWDAALALLGSVEAVPGLTLHALAGVALLSPLPADVPLRVRPLRPTAELSAAFRFDGWSLLVEDRVTGPLVRDLHAVADLPPASVEASAYYGLALTENRIAVGLRRGRLTLWLSEDWTPGRAPRSGGPANWFHNSNAPDVALGLTWIHAAASAP